MRMYRKIFEDILVVPFSFLGRSPYSIEHHKEYIGFALKPFRYSVINLLVDPLQDTLYAGHQTLPTSWHRDSVHPVGDSLRLVFFDSQRVRRGN